MGTKNKPGQFDCYANAAPDEPMFVLLARDPVAPLALCYWIGQRWRAMQSGLKPMEDQDMLREAAICMAEMITWRHRNRFTTMENFQQWNAFYAAKDATDELSILRRALRRNYGQYHFQKPYYSEADWSDADTQLVSETALKVLMADLAGRGEIFERARQTIDALFRWIEDVESRFVHLIYFATDGRLSKTNYVPSVLDSETYEARQRAIDEAIQEDRKERGEIGLLDALRQAAAKFREYEAHHRAKPDPEKAQRNAEMAELCEGAIADAERHAA